MAYTITPQVKSYLPGLTVIAGTYSSVNTDTVTVTVPGGGPIILLFTDAQNNVVTTQTMSAKATSGGVTTYTLTSTGTVTNGSFLWVVAGS